MHKNTHQKKSMVGRAAYSTVTRVGGVDVTVGEILSILQLEEQFTLGFTVVGGGVGTQSCCNGAL